VLPVKDQTVFDAVNYLGVTFSHAIQHILQPRCVLRIGVPQPEPLHLKRHHFEAEQFAVLVSNVTQ
jgi:hypothetical protein